LIANSLEKGTYGAHASNLSKVVTDLIWPWPEMMALLQFLFLVKVVIIYKLGFGPYSRGYIKRVSPRRYLGSGGKNR
jgi:hypothetical protein